jgi:hypothetical protein
MELMVDSYGEIDEHKKNSHSQNYMAKKMRELRKKKAIREGRDVGVKGRPKIISSDSADFIVNKIKEDANNCVFHNVDWVQNPVFYS